jgi:hypothetical protein
VGAPASASTAPEAARKEAPAGAPGARPARSLWSALWWPPRWTFNIAIVELLILLICAVAAGMALTALAAALVTANEDFLGGPAGLRVNLFLLVGIGIVVLGFCAFAIGRLIALMRGIFQATVMGRTAPFEHQYVGIRQSLKYGLLYVLVCLAPPGGAVCALYVLIGANRPLLAAASAAAALGLMFLHPVLLIRSATGRAAEGKPGPWIPPLKPGGSGAYCKLWLTTVIIGVVYWGAAAALGLAAVRAIVRLEPWWGVGVSLYCVCWAVMLFAFGAFADARAIGLYAYHNLPRPPDGQEAPGAADPTAALHL